MEIGMRTTQSLSITLPHEMAQMIKAKVSAGEYATESEVIREGLRALQGRDEAFERWLRTEAVKSYEEYKADPSNVMPAKDVLDHIRKRYRERITKKASQ
jgi:putative addiction module CopG family antidote